MLKQSVALGLCAACKHSPGCVYEVNSGRMIRECGQFEMGVRAPVDPGTRAEFRPLADNGNHFGKFPGLCSNCDHRDTCVYPKPEGGVWHCDEYA